MKMNSFRILLPALALAIFAGPVRSDDSKPLAKVGDITLTEKQLSDDLGSRYYDAQNNLYQLQKQWVDQKATDIVFNQAAKDAGMSRKDWEAQQIDANLPQPTMQEIQQILQRYPAQSAASTDTLRQVSQYLQMQKRMEKQAQVYQQLQAKYPVTMLVQKPEAPHINVTYAADDPVKGPKNAPVTIVEFTDFQCPYCKRSQDAIHQIESTYPTQVKIVARQYPLPFHNRARPAAEASLCALDQGKYWDYREKLFDKQQLEDADFTRYATELSMNVPKFQKCLADHKYAARIDKDIADGQKFGVQGTPHFFINGTPVSGAQPFEAFKTVIDDSLTTKKS